MHSLLFCAFYCSYNHDEFVINDNEIIQKLREHVDKEINSG